MRAIIISFIMAVLSAFVVRPCIVIDRFPGETLIEDAWGNLYATKDLIYGSNCIVIFQGEKIIWTFDGREVFGR